MRTVKLLARSPGTRYAPTTIVSVLQTTGGETITTTGGDPISVRGEKNGGRAWIVQAKRASRRLHAKKFGNPLVVNKPPRLVAGEVEE